MLDHNNYIILSVISSHLIKQMLHYNRDDISKSVILKQCFQSYYQQADSLTRDKSCYQLVDSMTEKRCHLNLNKGLTSFWGSE